MICAEVPGGANGIVNLVVLTNRAGRWGMRRWSTWGSAMRGDRCRRSKRSGSVADSGQRLCANFSKHLLKMQSCPASLPIPK
jgi:hypothetical protein